MRLQVGKHHGEERRHPVPRNRQPWRRQARAEGGFRPLHDQPEISRFEVLRAAQPRLQDSRAFTSASPCCSSGGRVSASREAHARLYINNAYEGLYTIVESIDKTWLQENLGEDGGDALQLRLQRPDLPHYFEYKGADPASYVPSPFKPETNESRSAAGFSRGHDSNRNRARRRRPSSSSSRRSWIWTQFINHRRRNLPRRFGWIQRQLGHEQFLHWYPSREVIRRLTKIIPLGQERGVQGRPDVSGLSQHLRRARVESQPADDARAERPAVENALPRYAGQDSARSASEPSVDSPESTPADTLDGWSGKSSGNDSQIRRRDTRRHDQDVLERRFRRRRSRPCDLRAPAQRLRHVGSRARPDRKLLIVDASSS